MEWPANSMGVIATSRGTMGSSASSLAVTLAPKAAASSRPHPFMIARTTNTKVRKDGEEGLAAVAKHAAGAEAAELVRRSRSGGF